MYKVRVKLLLVVKTSYEQKYCDMNKQKAHFLWTAKTTVKNLKLFEKRNAGNF